MVQLAMELMIGSTGRLDGRYEGQEASDPGVHEKVLVLQEYLRHDSMAGTCSSLLQRMMEASAAGGGGAGSKRAAAGVVRLLKLTGAHLFEPQRLELHGMIAKGAFGEVWAAMVRFLPWWLLSLLGFIAGQLCCCGVSTDHVTSTCDMAAGG